MSIIIYCRQNYNFFREKPSIYQENCIFSLFCIKPSLINQEKPALRLTSLILFILVLPFTLLHQTKQLLKRLHLLRPHLPRIHHLPICFHPVQHIMLLYPMPRWVTMVGFNKLNHLLVPCQPSRSLIHTSDISHQPSDFCYHRSSCAIPYSSLFSSCPYTPPSQVRF